MSKSNINVKIVNGEEFCGFTAICKTYMGNGGRVIVDDFVRVLTKLNIFEKEVKKYESKTYYNYLLKDWFAEHIENQYIVTGAPSRRKVYFNQDSCELLVEIYRTYKDEEPAFEQWDSMVKRVINDVQVRQGKIKPVIERDIESLEELIEQLRIQMTDGITNVISTLNRIKSNL